MVYLNFKNRAESTEVWDAQCVRQHWLHQHTQARVLTVLDAAQQTRWSIWEPL